MPPALPGEAWSPSLRCALAATAVVVFVLAWVAMTCAGRAMKDDGGVGIVAFARAKTPGRAGAIKTTWGTDGQAAARKSLLIDFVFIAAYVLLPLVIAGAAAEVARERDWSGWTAVAVLAGWAFVLAGLFDVVEDLLLLLVLAKDPPPSAATWGAWGCARAKSGLLIGGAVVLITAVVAARAGDPPARR